ncbi:germin-like protein subfamily 1 member 1 [Momordica charantia]|uniref:Germin-like protein n=1 Tax=Momordica charantia TaxID=3673 RepID=A0A6J1DCS2_MOMCH|nr:germin-like protein subfamily 1 member 1 [Momordica charantia]
MATNSSLFLCFFLLLLCFVNLCCCDPDPLQDYCVANPKSSSMFFNGVACINPNFATTAHFTTSALSKPGNTRNLFGFSVTATNTDNLPGLNTLGLTLARIDLQAQGVVPLHSHPRASEITICLGGHIVVGFVDTSNRVFSKKIGGGESFVFPKGLLHFMYNDDSKNSAVAVSGLNSQNPGAQLTALAAFASKPDIPPQVLKKSFQITDCDIARIRRSLGG